MPNYLVKITETLQHQEVIEANSEEEALDRLKDKYRREEIVLDYSNHMDTKFSVWKEVNVQGGQK